MQDNGTYTMSLARLDEVKSILEKDKGLHTLKLINDLPIGICLTDNRGRFEDMNEAYCNMYGYEQSELIGNNFAKMVVPEHNRQRLNDAHEQFIEKEKEISNIWQVRRKDGKVLYVLANAVHMNLHGQPKKLTLVIDVSDIKKTEKRLNATIRNLEDALERQEDATSMTLHDIRKPIGSIVSIADVMLSGTITEDEYEKWLKVMKRLGMQALDSLELLMGLRRMEKGTFEADVQIFDLLNFTEDIKVLEADKEFRQKQLAIQLHYEEKPVSEENNTQVKGDRAYLLYMINNLVRNSLEASPEKSVIHIDFALREESFVIRIRNQGEVPEAIRKDFFKKYVSQGKQKGTGLGTYIASLIVKAHEGTIELDSSESGYTIVVATIPQ